MAEVFRRGREVSVHSRSLPRRGGARRRRATDMGLPAAETVTLRRSALAHDLGRIGVSNLVWEKAGPLTSAERERVRLHAYLTDRMLSRPETLKALAEVAGRLLLAIEHGLTGQYPL